MVEILGYFKDYFSYSIPIGVGLLFILILFGLQFRVWSFAFRIYRESCTTLKDVNQGYQMDIESLRSENRRLRKEVQLLCSKSEERGD